MGYAYKLAGAQIHNDTLVKTADGNYDMGVMHKYRYINFKKSHTDTYTVPSNGTHDMGVNHKYRYISSSSHITTLGSTNSIETRTFGATGIPGWSSLNLNNFKVQFSMTHISPFKYATTQNGIPTSYSGGVLTCNRLCYGSEYSGSTIYMNYTVYVTY